MFDATSSPALDKSRNIELVFGAPDVELVIVRTEDIAPRLGKRLPIAFRHDIERLAGFQRDLVYQDALSLNGVLGACRPTRVGDDDLHVFDDGGLTLVCEVLRQCDRLESRLPLPLATLVIRQTLDALEAALGRIRADGHGTWSVPTLPETVAVRPSGEVVLVHVGLSRPPIVSSSIVNRNKIKYLEYAAPEQCGPGREPGLATDFFGLGMFIHHLLTGRPLFSKSRPSALAGMTRRKLRLLHPRASDIDPALTAMDEVILRLLEPLPESRETDIGRIGTSLDDLIGSCGIAAPAELAAYLRETRAMVPAAATVNDTGQPAATLSGVDDIAQYNAS